MGLTRVVAAVTVALSLGACLVSEEPVLDAKNAKAKPLAPGAYQSCQYEEQSEASECVPLLIERKGALYRLLPADENEATLVRFRAIGGGAFLAQLTGEAEEEGYFYFYADTAKGLLRMVMMACEDLPETLRDALATSGDLVIEDGGSTCVVKTVKGAAESAKAYRDGAAPIDAYMVIAEAAAAE